MRISFTKKMKCKFTSKVKDCSICDKELREKLENFIDSDQEDHHITIRHEQNNHKFWVFYYESEGVHESELNGKVWKRNVSTVKKYPKKLPKESEIINLLKDIS